jgi:hypothetical protein
MNITTIMTLIDLADSPPSALPAAMEGSSRRFIVDEFVGRVGSERKLSRASWAERLLRNRPIAQGDVRRATRRALEKDVG